MDCIKANDDKRPESYKISYDTIKVLEILEAGKDKWSRRKSIVLPTLEKSMCHIKKLSRVKDVSLGLIKPSNINFYWVKRPKRDDKDKSKYYAQLDLFGKKKDEIEQIPYNFYYSFRCDNEPDCNGHKMLIIDWELHQSYRKWRSRYFSQKELLEKIRERWLERNCSIENDVYFFVGNMKRHRNNFMILGVFYPPKVD